jgi:hypothetical protein
MDRERFDDERVQRVKTAAGNLALLTLQNPNQYGSQWGSVVDTHLAELRKRNPNATLDASYYDPKMGPLKVLADAGMAPQYMDYKLKLAAESRASAAESRAAAMHAPQLDAARIQAATAKRDFENPRATADINAGHQRTIYDPRTGAHVATIKGPEKPPDATDRKAAWEAEDDLPNLRSAIDQLTEARGYGGAARAAFNQAAPGIMPNIITDPEMAKRTQRYNQILGTESIAAMSQTLKGATTDFEMREFSRLMNDPNQSVETKMKALNSMLTKAQNHYAMKEKRLRELGRQIPNLQGAGGGASGSPADPLGIR